LTSRSVEYTTITDEIDTSCMIIRSPPRSPTSMHGHGGDGWDDDGLEATHIEKTALRQAEEMEHRRMERIIRNRLRQISIDESGSISDIARLAVSEMEVEDVHSDHEDDESIIGSTEHLAHDDNLTPSTPPRGDDGAWSPTDPATEEGPIVFEAAGPAACTPVEIRIRRASTLEEDMPKQQVSLEEDTPKQV